MALTELEQLAEKQWDRLHAQPRFRPRFPSEGVVRFLSSHFPEPRGLEGIDIGVGGGRHLKLLCELGFRATGVDVSPEGLRHCGEWLRACGLGAELRQASMFDLPFPDGAFDVAIAHGVFPYADAAGLRRAVAELYRILRPGGRGFVVLRTTDDYRFGKGEMLEPRTFRLDIAETNEHGSVQHFLAEQDVRAMFAAFGEVSFERADVTFGNRTGVNSDWLVQVRR